MSILSDVGLAVLGLGVGAALGWSPPAPREPAGPPGPATHVPRVCRSTTVFEGDCANLEVQRDWCAARVRAATRVRPTSAPPEAVGIDDPEAWQARVRGMLDACDLPVTLANTDCQEYPCVSALRANAPGEMGFPLEKCEGEVPMSESEWPALLPILVDCGDGETETLWLFAIVDQDTLNLLYPTDGTALIPSHLPLLAARRAEALASGWVCSG